MNNRAQFSHRTRRLFWAACCCSLGLLALVALLLSWTTTPTMAADCPDK